MNYLEKWFELVIGGLKSLIIPYLNILSKTNEIKNNISKIRPISSHISKYVSSWIYII